MRPPEFWARDGAPARLLSPLGSLYTLAGRWRRRLARPLRLPVQVVCAGNLTVGGAGKTPLCLALAKRLIGQGQAPHFLTRGYRGRCKGPLRVDPARHQAADVGDEALLLAAVAPTWVARERRAGAAAAVAAGASVLIMDDGFQNPALVQDVGLIVIDGEVGWGNCRVLPAGPLREPVADGLARASAVVLVGEDRTGIVPLLPEGFPCLRANLAPLPRAGELRGARVLAFAGIGRPDKFFASLRAVGAELAGTRVFPDHHPFRDAQLEALATDAERLGAQPVTTAKDHVRLPPNWRPRVAVLPVQLTFCDPAALDRLLGRACPCAR